MISHLGLGEIEARLIAAGSNIGPETARVGEELEGSHSAGLPAVAAGRPRGFCNTNDPRGTGSDRCGQSERQRPCRQLGPSMGSGSVWADQS